LDKLEVNVEMRPQKAVDYGLDSDESTTLAKQLEHDIKSYLGVSSAVNVLAPASIERSAVGKATRVIDKRPKQ